jgi:hypothetical protein
MSEFTIELGSPLHLNEELWCLFVDQMKQVANYCHQIGFYLFFHLFTFFFIFFPFPQTISSYLPSLNFPILTTKELPM